MDYWVDLVPVLAQIISECFGKKPALAVVVDASLLHLLIQCSGAMAVLLHEGWRHQAANGKRMFLWEGQLCTT